MFILFTLDDISVISFHFIVDSDIFPINFTNFQVMSKPATGRGFGRGRGRGIVRKVEATPLAPSLASCTTNKAHINQPSERNLTALTRKGRGRSKPTQTTNTVNENSTPLVQEDIARANTNTVSNHTSSKTNSDESTPLSTSPIGNGTHVDQLALSSLSVDEYISNARNSQHNDRSQNSGFSSNNNHSRYSQHDDRSHNSDYSSNDSHSRYSYDDRSATNPKNRVLGRTKFTAPAMRSFNQAVGDNGTSNYKSNRPLGGEKCFNFSYKEPDVTQSKPPVELAIQSLGDGKHILEKGYDGQVDYISEFYPKNKADKLMHMLLGTLNFEAPSRKRGGETIEQPRLSVWYGPKDTPYSYSYVTLQAREFSSNSIMYRIKADVEEKFGVTFNSCLVNLYRDNKDGVGWHADDEKSLGDNPTIASLSLGETRRFEFCRKDDKERKPVYGFHLVHGSGLLMKGDVQERWLHTVPREYHDRKPRLNLTFRTIHETK